MIKNILSLLLIPCLIQTSAHDPTDKLTYYNSYHGTPITQETLLELAQQIPSDMKCEDLQHKAQKLVRKNTFPCL